MAKKNKKPKRQPKPKQPKAESRGVLVQKPRTTIYTSLLIVAFLGLMFGCIFMYLELARYGGFAGITAN